MHELLVFTFRSAIEAEHARTRIMNQLNNLRLTHLADTISIPAADGSMKNPAIIHTSREGGEMLDPILRLCALGPLAKDHDSAAAQTASDALHHAGFEDPSLENLRVHFRAHEPALFCLCDGELEASKLAFLYGQGGEVDAVHVNDDAASKLQSTLKNLSATKPQRRRSKKTT